MLEAVELAVLLDCLQCLHSAVSFLCLEAGIQQTCTLVSFGLLLYMSTQIETLLKNIIKIVADFSTLSVCLTFSTEIVPRKETAFGCLARCRTGATPYFRAAGGAGASDHVFTSVVTDQEPWRG